MKPGIADGDQQEDSDLSDPPTEPETPVVNKCRGLTRTYAMADVTAPAQAMKGQHLATTFDDDYEPVTEPEGNHEIESDDDPTPKKKQKVAKAPVREAVNASREEPEAPKGRSEVSTPSELQ